MKIGQKLRRLRKLRGLTIEEVATNADLTKGFISQLERDKTVPTVVSLKQVLDVLGVDLAKFFSDFEERERHIFVRQDRLTEESEEGHQLDSLIPRMRYLEMEPQLLTLAPLATFSRRFEEDEGFGFLVKGRVRMTVNAESRTLNRGDCCYLFFDNQYEVENLTRRPAELLMVNY